MTALPALEGCTTHTAALEGCTTHAALAAGEADIAGRTAAGFRADLTALAVDPATAPADEVTEAPVRLTVAGGRSCTGTSRIFKIIAASADGEAGQMGDPRRRRGLAISLLALLPVTGCGAESAAKPCEGIRIYPAHTTETAAALLADPTSAERFKAAVARHGSGAERAAVRHVTGFSSPDEDLASLNVETDHARPSRIDGTSDEHYLEKDRAHDLMEQEGKVIVQALSKWWRGHDESQPGHVEPWVWVQYDGDGGSMARELFERSGNFCAPSEG
ncbi:amidohydrolase family protein [Streptomyces sp. NPDC003635]